MTANREDVYCLLLAARCLISDPADWTQGTNARDAIGRGVLSESLHATSWCADGALMACDPIVGAGRFPDESPVYCAAAELLDATALDGSPVDVNDIDGHAATLAMYDRAIELAAA